jgi:hypothetical protein
MRPRFSTWSSAFCGRKAKASLGAISEWGAASGNAHRLSSRCLRCITDGAPVRPDSGAVRRRASEVVVFIVSGLVGGTSSSGASGEADAILPVKDRPR